MLLGAATAIGLLDAEIRPIRLSMIVVAAPSETGARTLLGESSQEGFISLEASKSWHADPTAVFIDASSPEHFRSGCIPGSFSLPPDAFAGGAIPDLLDELSRDFQIIVYCRTSECDAAELVAIRMQEFGFPHVLVFKDGFAAWKAAGLPVQTGS